MADASALLDSLHGIAARMDGDMSEKDVENAFLNEEFYTNLGYAGAGHDLRSEWSLPDNRRPDYVTLDSNESITAVYEFKTTGRDLAPHEDQLFHYMDELKAGYGVLTNGGEVRLYRRAGHERYLTVSLAETTESQARDLASSLGKPDWDVTSPDHVGEYLDELDGRSSPNSKPTGRRSRRPTSRHWKPRSTRPSMTYSLTDEEIDVIENYLEVF